MFCGMRRDEEFVTGRAEVRRQVKIGGVIWCNCSWKAHGISPGAEFTR